MSEYCWAASVAGGGIVCLGQTKAPVGPVGIITEYSIDIKYIYIYIISCLIDCTMKTNERSHGDFKTKRFYFKKTRKNQCGRRFLFSNAHLHPT